MTSQPKNTSGPSQSENVAGNTADTSAGAAPLDRSSPEWRSQFGVLPSAYQQSGAAPVGARKRNPAFIAGAIAVVGVVGLIAYGYFPSLRAGEPSKAGVSPAGATIASGSSVKNTRDKVEVATPPSPSPSPAAPPAAKPAAVVANINPIPEKGVAKVVTAPRPAVVAPKAVRAAVAAVPEAMRQEPTPQPRRAKPQPPVVRSAPAPVAVVATPRPEPKAAVVKPAAKPAVKPAPAQQLPKASRPNSESIESDGTNPLGLPQ